MVAAPVGEIAIFQRAGVEGEIGDVADVHGGEAGAAIAGQVEMEAVALALDEEVFAGRETSRKVSRNSGPTS